MFVGDENHVETRLIANYVQMFTTLIGQIISELTSDTDYDLNVNLFCVDKFYVKSCFKNLNVLRTVKLFDSKAMTSQLSTFLSTASLNMHLKMI